MTRRHHSAARLSRRAVTAGVLAGVGGTLLGCSSASSPSPGATSPLDGGAARPENDAAGGSDGGAPATGRWASGGTKSMTGNYPDPFTTTSTACVIAATATGGPCTELADRARKDISEGYVGVPMRLALKIVDAQCQPIAGALVKVWHTQVTGSYSGDVPDPACLLTGADGAVHYFRGTQTTDASGRVDFDSCFPGWYPGRAIHIHYTVSRGGVAHTSQLVFEQALVDEIFSTHVDYKRFGMPDTTNASDGIISATDLPTFMLVTSRMDDGAMMAAKELVVRVS